MTHQSVQVTVADADFGFGPAPWTNLEVVDPAYYSPATFSALYPPDFATGYFVDFQPTALSYHPAPEPRALELLALAGLPLLLRRRVTR